jgi:hypothetical protein
LLVPNPSHPSAFSRYFRLNSFTSPPPARPNVVNVAPGYPTVFPTVCQTNPKRHPDPILPVLPPLPRAVRPTSPEFVAKLQLCQRLCDFTDLASDTQAKDLKLPTLQELDGVFSDLSFLRAWPPGLFHEFFQLLCRNLFRELPPIDPVLICGVVKPPIVEVSRSHLHLVYSLLLKYRQANPTDSRLVLAFCHQQMHSFISE